MTIEAGDTSEAKAIALAALGAARNGSTPEVDDRQLWDPLDLTEIITAIQDGVDLTPTTGVLHREDGVGLFYSGKVHTIQGEPESLKSWICFIAAVTTILNGGNVTWVDLEDDQTTAVLRLHQLGLDLDLIAQRFSYLQPEVGLLGPHGRNVNAQQSLEDHLEATRPDLIVVDSVGELSALQGLSILDNEDMTRQSSELKRLARESGACVLLIDHITKSNSDGKAIGAQAKGAAANGATFLLEMSKPFGIGLRGEATLKVGKDRAGGIRRHAVGFGRLQTLAHLFMVSDEASGRVGWELQPPEGAGGREWQPTGLMAKISKHLESEGDGATRTAIKSQMGGKAEYVMRAINALIAEGYATSEGDRSPVHHVKRYVDPELSARNDTESDPGPF